MLFYQTSAVRDLHSSPQTSPPTSDTLAEKSTSKHFSAEDEDTEMVTTCSQNVKTLLRQSPPHSCSPSRHQGTQAPRHQADEQLDSQRSLKKHVSRKRPSNLLGGTTIPTKDVLLYLSPTNIRFLHETQPLLTVRYNCTSSSSVWGRRSSNASKLPQCRGEETRV